MQAADHEIVTGGYPVWFLRFEKKLLEGDTQTLVLLRSNPFTGAPPRFLRAEVYLYHFTSPEDRKKTGALWKRELIGDYLRPIGLEQLRDA